MRFITYSQGYRFQLEEDVSFQTTIRPAHPGGNRFVDIDADGLLTISAGYAWDGASGPAINTHTIIRGSLAHDALYQLIRLGVVATADRDHADQLLRSICLEDGMWPPRAWWVYMAVRQFGGLYINLTKQGLLTAPREGSSA